MPADSRRAVGGPAHRESAPRYWPGCSPARRRGDSWFASRDLDDQSSTTSRERQIADLAAIGVTWDAEPGTRPHIPLATPQRSMTWPPAGWSTNVIAAEGNHLQAGAPRIAPEGAYPSGDLPRPERMPSAPNAARPGRPPALRCVPGQPNTPSRICCTYTGWWTIWCCAAATGAGHNLAVVVDDAAQGVDQVVRGDDLLASAPRQAYLGTLLGTGRRCTPHAPGPQHRRRSDWPSATAR